MPEMYPTQSPRTAWRVYDGEAVILWPDDSTLNTLNAVGTRIWESANGQSGVSAIVARICEDFDVEPERAERDTIAFIAKLGARGLVTDRIGDSSASSLAGGGNMEKRDERHVEAGARQRGKRTYEPPEILSQEVFETTALACKKVSGTGGQCNTTPKS
jgi:Coenzyme PQQ synthesis protein D (PqqD)